MFNPIEVCSHELVLEVIATEKNPKATKQSISKKFLTQKCSLKIFAKGNYPLLKIVDVRNDAISVATLWENFQINKINYELIKNLNDDEKQFLQIEQLNFKDAQSL